MRKGFIQGIIKPKLIGAILRFIIGVYLFEWAQPKIVALGTPSSLATMIVGGVLLGLGIWSYKTLPI